MNSLSFGILILHRASLKFYNGKYELSFEDFEESRVGTFLVTGEWVYLVIPSSCNVQASPVLLLRCS
jgi:hypothetical protein